MFPLTAHCTYAYKSNITIRMGSSKKEEGGDLYDVIKIINYPFFDITRLDMDYAILIPDRSIKFDYVNVRPIRLPYQNQVIPDDTLCTVSGWGK